MRRRVVGLVWNRRTRRPRLPWRLVAVVVVLAILSLGAGATAQTLRRSIVAAFRLAVPVAQATAAAGNVVFLASQAVIYLGTVYLVGRFVDRRWFRDFGLRLDRSWWVDLAFGLGLGAALMAGIFLVELAAGWVSITETFRIARQGVSFWPWLAWSLLVFVGVGVTEELLTRGYLLTNLAEGLTWFDRVGATGALALATLVSSLVFGVGHALNPNASLASTAGIVLAAVMLAAGYLLTGELAIPIGIHVTWNFFQGPVFGFPVSGIDFGVSVLAIEQRGPAVATGGSFGPEAGLLGVAASVVGTGLIVAWIYRREGYVRLDESIATPELRTGAEE